MSDTSFSYGIGEIKDTIRLKVGSSIAFTVLFGLLPGWIFPSDQLVTKPAHYQYKWLLDSAFS